MKAIYRIFIAIFAAAALTVSCSKDAVPGGGAQAVTDGPRVITLSFGGYTKSSLDGFTPKFSAGDRVMLSNGTRAEECTVNVDAKGKATVTTNLTGILNAVSPASAAVTGGGELTYKIPVTQSGRFSDAAIATAQDIISSAVFEIQVSLLKFYVDQSISVRSITITGTQNIATSGTNLKQITVDAGSGYLHSVTDDPQHRLCYVAVLPGIPASSLKFTSDTESQGIVRRQSPASTVTLAANTLYKAFIPYYIKIKVSSSPDVYQRWGYCNVGAFLPEEAGEYFAWGDIQGQTWNGSVWSGAGLSPSNYRFGTHDGKYTKYVLSSFPDKWGGSGEPDNKSVLEFADDAAYVNWGASWRMPTGGKVADAEFTILAKTCNPSYSLAAFEPTTTSEEPENQGVYLFVVADKKGIYFVDGIGNKLFFPITGYGNATGIVNSGNSAYYWSNNLYIDDGHPCDSGGDLTFDNGKVYPVNGGGRASGLCIRPIYKNPVDPLDIGEYDEPVNIE